MIELSKSDARRALVRRHFSICSGQVEAFERVRSIQFDPISPVGCNHDLVLQARVADYQIGDWEKTAYTDRLIYDGWDKQASLIPYDGWAVRRVFHDWADNSKQFLLEHAEAAATILKEIEEVGPMQPKDFEFQERREGWKGSWYGASLTKNVLRRLWNTGKVMTAGRRKGQHLYDLTERVVPVQFLAEPRLSEEESIREIVMERHRAMGILRQNAPPEIWASKIYLAAVRGQAIRELVDLGEIRAVNVEGMKLHASPAFLEELDRPSLEPRVVFVAPLDPFMWDRKMIAHLFGFDYVWEIYVPEAKRKWGYYVLPILFGDAFVGRAEFWARKGRLEIRRWHWESEPAAAFWPALEEALRRFMAYCGATCVEVESGLDPRVASMVEGYTASPR